MKIFSVLKHFIKKPAKARLASKRALSSLEDYKQEALIRQGRMQFEKLLQKGLSIPVAIL